MQRNPGHVDDDGFYRPGEEDYDSEDQQALFNQDWSNLKDPDSEDDRED